MLYHDKVVSQIILPPLSPLLMFWQRSHRPEGSFTVMSVVGTLCREFCNMREYFLGLCKRFSKSVYVYDFW